MFAVKLSNISKTQKKTQTLWVSVLPSNNIMQNKTFSKEIDIMDA